MRVGDLGIDLIVMGTLRRTACPALIGTTAEEILGEVDCSVVTVKAEASRPPTTRVER
jgi:nucleotide-binding universal stress UspA family protein